MRSPIVVEKSFFPFVRSKPETWPVSFATNSVPVPSVVRDEPRLATASLVQSSFLVVKENAEYASSFDERSSPVIVTTRRSPAAPVKRRRSISVREPLVISTVGALDEGRAVTGLVRTMVSVTGD